MAVDSVSIEIFRTFIEVLHERQVPYCLLSGFEDYPEGIQSDVDFMVPPERFPELPTVMHEVVARTGCQLVQAIKHESEACYFVLGAVDGAHVEFLHPDASCDYRRNGRLWLAASDVLERRQLHDRGFFVPAPQDALTYYLIKRIDKRSLSELHVSHMRRWYRLDPGAGLASMRRFWSAGTCAAIVRALEGDERVDLQESVDDLAAELNASTYREPVIARMVHWFGDRIRLLERVFAPTGLFVTFIGPDGCGKSSVIDRVQKELAPAFRKTYSFHLRPRLGQRTVPPEVVTAPHDVRPRGALASMVKVIYFLIDFNLGYWARLRPMMIRSTFVISDRYYHDILVDPKRFRFGLPVWVAGLVGRFVPKPDVWILLDAPAEVLQARKQEVPFEETARQRQAYLHLVRDLENSIVVNAAQPLDDVVADVLAGLMAVMADRTSVRLTIRAGHDA